MFQFDRDAGFTNLGENRISETTDLGENRDSVNRALRSNEKARSKEYTRNNDFDEKKQQQKTTTLARIIHVEKKGFMRVTP